MSTPTNHIDPNITLLSLFNVVCKEGRDPGLQDINLQTSKGMEVHGRPGSRQMKKKQDVGAT